MFKSALIVALLISQVSFAQTTLEASARALNSEILGSPIRTKQLYRAIRESDESQMAKKLAQLKKDWDNNVISERQYKQDSSAIQEAFRKAHPEDLATLSKAIEKAPVVYFVKAGNMTPERATFLNLVKIPQEKSDSEIQEKATASSVKSSDKMNNSVIQVNKKRLGKKKIPVRLDGFK